MSKQPEITLLYVDDEDPNLFLFRANFEDKYHVLTAKSGKEGLKVLENHHNEIIVVISDMRMPEMNGIDFIKNARKHYDKIHYYILTAYEYNVDIARALDDNVINRYFTKPFNAAEIEEAIHHAIETTN